MVNSSNQDSIAGDHITGLVRYDPTTNTLILQNAVIEVPFSSPDPFYEGIALAIGGMGGEVNIKLLGDNTITGITALYLYEGSFHIMGPGTLSINALSEGFRFDIDANTFHISGNAHVNINIPWTLSSGIWGVSNLEELIIDTSSVIINADKCIRGIKGFQLHGCYIASPENAYFDPNSSAIVDETGAIVSNHLEILPGTVGLPHHEDSEWHAWGESNGIKMANLPEGQTIEVFNTLGQTMYQSSITRQSLFLPLKKGFYLVRINKHTVKTIVR